MKKLQILITILSIPLMFSSCSKDVKYYLTSVTINSIPETQGSLAWDDQGGEEPDVFPALSASSGQVWELQNYQTSHLEDATNADLPFTFIIPNLELEAETRYAMELWDYDYITSNELMASINFTPEDLDVGSSATEITLTSGDASVTITVEKDED